MRPKATMKVERKRAARQWILAAIQSYGTQPAKETESEIRRFVRRIQRDITSLDRALVEFEKSRKMEIARLTESQARDEKDRRMRFEHAIRK